MSGRTENATGIVGRTSQRPDGGIGEGVEMPGAPLRLAFGFTVCRCQPLLSQWLSASLAQRFCKRCETGPMARRLAFPGPMQCCGFAHNVSRLEPSREVRAAWRALFLPHQEGALCSHKGSGVLSPLFLRRRSGHVLWLVCTRWYQRVHLAGSSGSQSPDLGDRWRHGCPKTPDWDSDGESWSESEGLSSSDFSRAQCGQPCLACHRAKLVGRKDVPLPGGLGTFEGGFECRVALDMLCQEMHEAWWLGASRTSACSERKGGKRGREGNDEERRKIVSR